MKINDQIRWKRFAKWHEMNYAIEAAITVVNDLSLAKEVAQPPQIWQRVINAEGDYY